MATVTETATATATAASSLTRYRRFHPRTYHTSSDDDDDDDDDDSNSGSRVNERHHGFKTIGTAGAVLAAAAAAAEAGQPGMGPRHVISFDVGTVNMGMFVGEYDSTRAPYYTRIVAWEKVNLTTNGHNTDRVDSVVTNMINTLHERPAMNTAGATVVIESQDVAMDIMKRLSNAIQAYYETRALLMGDMAMRVVFLNASEKFKVYAEPDRYRLQARGSTAHDNNKRTGVHHCEALLRLGEARGWDDFVRFGVWWRALSKQDDAADAFLQGVRYVCLTHMTRDELKAQKKLVREHKLLAIAAASEAANAEGDATTTTATGATKKNNKTNKDHHHRVQRRGQRRATVVHDGDLLGGSGLTLREHAGTVVAAAPKRKRGRPTTLMAAAAARASTASDAPNAPVAAPKRKRGRPPLVVDLDDNDVQNIQKEI